MSDRTPDLRAYMTDAVAEPLSRVLGNGHSLKLLGYQKVHYDCNWKAYVDNDGYHAPLLHLAFKLMGWQGGKGVQIITDNGHIAFDSELTIPGKIEALRTAPSCSSRATRTARARSWSARFRSPCSPSTWTC